MMALTSASREGASAYHRRRHRLESERIARARVRIDRQEAGLRHSRRLSRAADRAAAVAANDDDAAAAARGKWVGQPEGIEGALPPGSQEYALVQRAERGRAWDAHQQRQRQHRDSDGWRQLQREVGETRHRIALIHEEMERRQREVDSVNIR
jgi:hypothetical protein